MSIREIRIQGYRSIRNLRLRLQPVTVITGPNGCGKSNLYRALTLIAQAARGGFARALAHEGGMQSALWAGDRHKNDPVRMSLAAWSDDFLYELVCGLPNSLDTSFQMDPQVKEESVWHGAERRPSKLLCERRNTVVRVRDPEFQWADYPFSLVHSESVLSQLQEPYRFPDLWRLREQFHAWRFYHQFRTDLESPLRQW